MAVASAEAASVYGLEIIASDIADVPGTPPGSRFCKKLSTKNGKHKPAGSGEL